MVKIIVFNVGFGDLIHVEIKDKTDEIQFLVDVGRKSKYSRVADVLEKLGKKIDYVFLTHEHSDHVGGLCQLLDDTRFNVKGIILNLGWGAYPGPSNSDNMRVLYNKIINKKLSIATPQHFITINKKIAKYITILNPTDLNIYSDNPNSNSIVIALKNEDYYLLLMGDATVKEEKIMIARKDIDFQKVKFLKVGHHGSETSTSDDLLSAINNVGFSFAVCSCKTSRTSPPPHPTTLRKLKNFTKSIPIAKFECTGSPTDEKKDIYISAIKLIFGGVKKI